MEEMVPPSLYPWEYTHMLVLILRGIAGAGKDTFIRTKLDEMLGEKHKVVEVVSTDKFFLDAQGNYVYRPELIGKAHGWCLREFLGSLVMHANIDDDGNPVPVYTDITPVLVVNNTNCSVAEFAPYAALAQAYGCRLQIMTLHCPVEVAAERNIHCVPKEVVAQMHTNLTKGTLDMPSWWPHVEVQYVAPSESEAA